MSTEITGPTGLAWKRIPASQILDSLRAANETIGREIRKNIALCAKLDEACKINADLLAQHDADRARIAKLERQVAKLIEGNPRCRLPEDDWTVTQ